MTISTVFMKIITDILLKRSILVRYSYREKIIIKIRLKGAELVFPGVKLCQVNKFRPYNRLSEIDRTTRLHGLIARD